MFLKCNANRSKKKTFIQPKDDQPKLIGLLGTGDFFGERALLYDKERSATIKVIETMKCYVVTKRYFDQCLFPLKEIMRDKIRYSAIWDRPFKNHTNKGIQYKDLLDVKTLKEGCFGDVTLVQYCDPENKDTKKVFYALKSMKIFDIMKQKRDKYVLSEKNILAKMESRFIVKLLRFSKRKNFF